MMTAFSTALSALSAHSTAIDIVGNNLANLNTNGYKETDVSFHDLVTQNIGIGTGETQVGFGVGRPTTTREFTQGALQTTSVPLDAAIQGDGFMIVKTANNSTVYTRGGSLQVDKQGELITSSGDNVQGWTQSGGVLNTNGPITNISVPVGNLNAPVATTNVSLNLNLSASAVTATPSGTFSSSIQVFDSLGTAHTIAIDFTKTATAGQWNYTVASPDGTVTTTPASGSLTFDSSGNLQTPAAGSTMPTIKMAALTDGAADLNMTWNLYDGTSSRVTQYDQPSALSGNTQDGAAAAQLLNVGIGSGGTILAQYSNGQQLTVGQMAMAAIQNPDTLQSVGNGNYQVSSDTALPAVGTAGTGGRGQIVGGALESSTVDIAKQFTNLIVYQRGFQANAKVITTADALNQATIDLVR